MNRKRIKIGLIAVPSLAIVIGLIIILSRFNISIGNNKEVEELQNNINQERIYLLKISWGNDSRMAIGLDKNLKAGFGYNHPDKYEDNSFDEMFFYKMDNDTLYIYGADFEKPKIDRFKTKVKIIRLENYEFIQLGENKKYERLGLKVFPPKEIERLNYVDYLNKLHEKK